MLYPPRPVAHRRPARRGGRREPAPPRARDRGHRGPVTRPTRPGIEKRARGVRRAGGTGAAGSWSGRPIRPTGVSLYSEANAAAVRALGVDARRAQPGRCRSCVMLPRHSSTPRVSRCGSAAGRRRPRRDSSRTRRVSAVRRCCWVATPASNSGPAMPDWADGSTHAETYRASTSCFGWADAELALVRPSVTPWGSRWAATAATILALRRPDLFESVIGHERLLRSR